MNTIAVAVKKRRPAWLWRMLQVEALLLFVALVVYAMLAAMNQRPSLKIMLLSFLVVGNVLFPVAYGGYQLCARQRFPWNWVIFLPMQLLFGLLCAVASIFFLQVTGIYRVPFRQQFAEFGAFTMVIALVSNLIYYGASELQRKLRERNELLEQTVEKGTIQLQEQEEELKRAREIQQALLPNNLPQIAGAQIAGAWQPARQVGGDYFDVIKVDEKRIGICVGDVAGKGITAALLMANLQASFRALAKPDATPAEVCASLNSFLCANTAPGKFVTFFYAVLDSATRTLTYENAGHCPGLLLRANGETERLEGGGAVLGALPEWTYANYEVALRSGDKLVLVTDGITEAENATLEEFGEEQLLHAAREQHGSAIEIQRAIMQRVTGFCEGNFRDDATVVVLVAA